MKAIIVGILASVSMLLIKASRAFGFTDTDRNSATFTHLNIIPEYTNWISRQWGSKIGNNTAYCWRRSDQNMICAGDYWAASGDTYTYDMDRNYVNKYLFIMGYEKAGSTDLPETFPAAGSYTMRMFQITTTYQNLLDDSNYQIRALNAGGFEIKCNIVGGGHMAAMIFEGRYLTAS